MKLKCLKTFSFFYSYSISTLTLISLSYTFLQDITKLMDPTHCRYPEKENCSSHA